MRGSTILFVLLILSCILLPPTFSCPPSMKNKCFCGESLYENSLQMLVNCTNAEFTTTESLSQLPPDIEVLIFAGNNISELPWNVFGTLRNYSKLRVVDMSNNQIREVKGKAYHHVPNVKRLILNHNRISIAEEFHHPRIFSNFVNLEELHLTNAFEDAAKHLGIDLHDIFISSNLTKLMKLHLEQNEISSFLDQRVFCDLPNLLDLYLGDNLLRGLDFDIECLHKLRYIDLERNAIVGFSVMEMQKLDALPMRNQKLTLNLKNNPFQCHCGNDQLTSWLSSTRVSTVLDRSSLSCLNNSVSGLCRKMASSSLDAGSGAVFIVLSLILLVFTFVIAIYCYRGNIRRLLPVHSASKVSYSSIENNCEQAEIAV